jgi:tRNA-splicing ligase RtcB
MSRTKAEANFTREGLNQYLKQEGVKLIGGGTDEAPGAYKDIHSVMAAQTELVEVLASFQPKLVRMADDGSRED